MSAKIRIYTDEEESREIGIFGPYGDKFEADDALRKRGWKSFGAPYSSTLIKSVNGQSCMAEVIEEPDLQSPAELP